MTTHRRLREDMAKLPLWCSWERYTQHIHREDEHTEYGWIIAFVAHHAETIALIRPAEEPHRIIEKTLNEVTIL